MNDINIFSEILHLFLKVKKGEKKDEPKEKNVIYKTDPLLGINYMCSMASYMLVISS